MLLSQAPIYVVEMIVTSKVYLTENKKFLDKIPADLLQQGLNVSFTQENNLSIIILSALTPVIVNYL